MFTEERDRWDVRIGVLLVALVVGGVYLARRHQPQEPPATTVETITPLAASPRVQMGAAVVKRTSDAPIAFAYECNRNGQKVLSDRPCSSDAAVREIAAPNRMDAQDTRRLYSPVSVPSRTRSGPSSGGRLSGTSAVCDSIEAQIDAINARMRRAYTSWEGERFRDRLRELSRQRYEAECIR